MWFRMGSERGQRIIARVEVVGLDHSKVVEGLMDMKRKFWANEVGFGLCYFQKNLCIFHY